MEDIPSLTRNIVLNIRADSNILLALNGSKLHSIGAILFAKKYRDIQLIASTPSEYFPSNYSYGVRKTFEIIFTLDWLKKFLVE